MEINGTEKKRRKTFAVDKREVKKSNDNKCNQAFEIMVMVATCV